jgi:murein DD-endopeptidase MepM/ murein hydrolase activator NlpD
VKFNLFALVACALLSVAEAATGIYTVKAGDTLYRIAKARNVNMTALEAVNPKLDLTRALQIGQVIQLPIVTRTAGQSAVAVIRSASIRVSWNLPVQGVITTPYYGTPEHSGIDIAAPLGTPIRVSRTGTVTESRFDPRTGWGWTIVVDYGGGALARYSHNQMNLVRVGDTVEPGQVIARLGSTGNSTGPHVDYRVTFNGVPVNPLSLQ